MVNFKGKTILITGGTGTIGESLLTKLLENYNPKRIRIYSRDETKQYYLTKKFADYDEILRFLIGDIRDKERLNRAMKNVDIVFHLAAQKHVLACEYNPFEAIKTNVIGLQNLVETCIDNNIEKFIFTSSDKAATPSNTMGVTKLLGEKLVTAANYYKGDAQTIFYSVRFGNVLGSRGSLIPIIEEQVKNNSLITLTHSKMTRYIMSINTAIDFILKTMDFGQGGEVFVHKMDIVKILDLIEVLIEIFAKKHNKAIETIEIKEIGMFAGEKLYEELFSIEESERTYETDNMFVIIPQLRDISSKLNLKLYPNIKKFELSNFSNSNEGPFLSKNEIKDLLIKKAII